MKYKTTVNGKEYQIEISPEGNVIVNGEVREIDFHALQAPSYSMIINNASYEALVEVREGVLEVDLLGDLFEVSVADERQQRLAAARGDVGGETGELPIRSPMPGLIVAVPVTEGQQVNKGDSLIVLESMKMENELKAPRGGTVQKVHVQKGDRVEQNKILVLLV